MATTKIDELLSALGQGVNGNGEVRYCDCDETLIDGERMPAPEFHNCRYVHCRNLLIPAAGKIATELAGTSDGTGWTRHFAQAMTELARRCL